ncbi:MAG: efflux RND transporter periplasmic adaptor subunit [Gammaproteobacteria bacterium HGW-Gammaproteobacteria-14]|nr:MAG: efflux RND transporter periplasmic adaptor subunit [Gammaproteobacteria bacterium HGW-Gammaproteobacteria-14]
MSDRALNMSSLLQRYRALSGRWRVGLWVLLAVLFISLLRCGNGNGGVEQESFRPVKLHAVSVGAAAGARHFIGRVDAVSTVDLSFQVGGRITELPVQQGTLVPKGSLIAALDPADYRLALREAELQLEQASRDLERTRSLYERGNIPRANLDQIETTHHLRAVALDTARRNLAYTRINAPFDALVTRRLVDPFTNVQANAEIVRVQNVDEFRVHINVPENLMAAVNDPTAMTAQAIFHGHQDQPQDLLYREHETEPDAVAQTYRVTFGMPRPDAMNVLPGMTVSVRVTAALPMLAESHEIPPSALDSDENAAFRVWVYLADSGTVTPRPVQMLGLNEDNMALVLGLTGDEQIVSAGTHLLSDGMRVKPFDGF